MNSCLQPMQRCIAAAGVDQRVMGAVLDQAAALERDDAIGRPHRREPVRDDQNRPPLGNLFHILLNDALALIVEGARRLIEDQNARVGDERAGNGDALALATGEGGAALADNRVVAFGKFEDEFSAPGSLAAAMTRSIGMAGSASAIFSRTERLNSTFSCRTTPIWRRSQAGSTMARSMPSTRTRPLYGT